MAHEENSNIKDSESSVEPITHIILACDESGAKGYADMEEQFPGEVGVFAGIMLGADCLLSVQGDFNDVATRFTPASGKLHITALPPASQKALREEMYGLIRKHKLPCFYEAVHVAGFRAAHKNFMNLMASSQAVKKSSIKMSNNKLKPESLHVALFQGLYARIVAFCMERNRTRLHIEIRTDKVDFPIVKDFEKSALALTDYGVKIKTVTGFDPISKQCISGTITIGETSPGVLLNVTIENFELRVVGDNDGLVVAADVLANSLKHLFCNRSTNEKFRALNIPEAFANHPLQEHLDSFNQWGGYNFTDTFYRHPLDPELIKKTAAE